MFGQSPKWKKETIVSDDKTDFVWYGYPSTPDLLREVKYTYANQTLSLSVYEQGVKVKENDSMSGLMRYSEELDLYLSDLKLDWPKDLKDDIKKDGAQVLVEPKTHSYRQ